MAMDTDMDGETVKPPRQISNEELDNVKNYLAVSVAYDLAICLPYKDGIAFMAALEKAEVILMDRYGNKSITFKVTSLELHSSIVSQKEYRTQKMKQLLGADDD
jgi:hypothetical protein